MSIASTVLTVLIFTGVQFGSGIYVTEKHETEVLNHSIDENVQEHIDLFKQVKLEADGIE